MTHLECRDFAQRYCAGREMRYLSHEHYFHSNGRYNYLKVAVEDYSGRYEIEIDLNAVNIHNQGGE